MTAVRIRLPSNLSPDFQEKVDTFFRDLCTRLSLLNEEGQAQLFDRLSQEVHAFQVIATESS